MIHEMPKLPYDMEALAPKMSKETFDYHYGKHLQTYVNNLNKFIAGTEFENMNLEDIIRNAQGPTFNNAAQTWNHTIFFMSLTPEQKEIPSTLSDKINSTFGSIEKFKEEFTKSALGVFGSGWTWLVKDNENNLVPNQYVLFKINSENYNSATNLDGEAEITLNRKLTSEDIVEYVVLSNENYIGTEGVFTDV